jgi:pilus assembly protein FimV
MRRILALSGLILALGSLPFSALALGLGTIHLHSALGQKLDADIALVGVDAQSASGLKIALASPARYKQAEVSRSATVESLKFKVVRGANGYHVHVTSARPVREPFLTFLISANWSSGQMVRQYTVLLNPPNYAAGGHTSAAASTGNAPGGASRSARSANTSPRPGGAQPSSAAATGSMATGGNYGPIKRGETLWGIARRQTSGGPANVDKMMIAIYRANPNAFSGNINRLKAGGMLTIPSRADVGRIDRRAAIDAVRKANHRYIAATAPAKAPAENAAGTNHEAGQAASTTGSGKPSAGKNAEASNAETNTTAANEASGKAGEAKGAHLKLLAPGSAAAKSAMPGSDGKQAAKVEKLQDQLTQAQQKAARAADKNESLSGKVDKLQGQVDKQKHLLSVKDNQLNQLQKRVRQQQAAANNKSTVDKIVAVLDTPLVLIGILVVIVLLIVAAVIRKQQRKRAEGEGAVPVAAAPGGSSRNRWAVNEDKASEAVIDEEPSQPNDEATVEAVPDEAVGASDPIAEADFHLDYGLYDQAAEVVRLGIEAEPGRSDLKLKLFQTYFAAGDAAAFGAAAREYASGWGADHPAEWEEVTSMGRQLVPNEPLFAAGHEGGEPSESADSPTELPTEVPTEVGAETATELTDAEDVEHEETIADPRDEALDIDFELDEPAEPESPSVEAEAAATQASGQGGSEAPAEATTEDVSAEEPRETEPPESVDLSDLEAELHPETKPGAQDGTERSLLDTQTEFEDAIRELSEFVDTNFPGSTADEGDADTEEAAQPVAESGPAAQAVEFPAPEAEDDVLADDEEADEMDTKLDLARAYMDMGDPDGARSILEEVMEEGAADHQERARTLLDKVG